MILKALISACSAAILVLAAPERQFCSHAIDVSDIDPACKVAGTPSPYQPTLLNISKWIWTGENPVPAQANPAGTRVFRKTIATPCGKCAIGATIVVASDDTHVIYVNGVSVGSGGGWTKGQVINAALKPSSNLFAISAHNEGGFAGIIATISIYYSDGTRDSFITDESWKTVASSTLPPGFQLASTNDSTWGFSSLQASYPKAVWGEIVLPPVLSLNQSKWIWTSDHHNGVAPVGARSFRKIINDCSKSAKWATVVIVADDRYTLYVNGHAVGSGKSSSFADAYTIPNLRPTYNTFAINATNAGGPAGVIATILITYTDGSSETIVTDSSWKAFKGLPEGFELTYHDESDWEDAKTLGSFGIQPWGCNVCIPDA